MAQYTIVKNGIVDNIIEASEEYVNANHDNDIVIQGSMPLGYVWEDGYLVSPHKILVDTNDIVPTSGYTNPAITVITVAAMRARLTVSEREAIRNSTDIFVKDIWDDLLSRSYIDLNDTLTVQGIAYITNYLTGVPDVFDNNVMTVTDLATRSAELLINGAQSEKYNGVL